LQPWQRNPLKRLSKNPKLHFLDPGIQQAVLRKQGELSGHEYESAIVAEIYKQFMQSAIPGELYHLRTSDGREIDLLIELEEGYIAIEIKYTRNAGSIDARHLSGLDQILDKPVIHSFILSNDMNVKQLTSGITAIPAAMFLT
jgi:predicted AAA+ superfamily ATPase